MSDDKEVIKHLVIELTALRIRVTQLEVELTATASTTRAAAAEAESVEKATAAVIKVGDRVRIKNTLRKPANWPVHREWDRDQAQLATHLKKDQIHFVTDNGVKTWCAVQNLIKIHQP
jgi:threonyl-tRNA synthetase